jgi:exonuclease SbcC
MENTMRCLDRLVETARAEQPDIILVAGDIFHTARVWSDRALTEVRMAAEYINLLSQFCPIAVLYGTPNHDGEQQFTTLQAMTPGIIYFTEPGIKTMLTKSGPIQIAGLPGFDKGHFRAQYPGLSAEEENKVFTQQLAQVVQGLSAQVNPTISSVLMAHHTVVGCELDNGTHVFQANEVVLDAATLDNSNFDLVCLGHIHKAQKVEACIKQVYYAGSIDAFTFNDEGHIKGFWIHDTEGDSRFFDTPAKEFCTVKITASSVEKFNYMTDEFKKMIENKVVRFLYTCDSETEKALDKKKLDRDLYAAGAYYVSEIRPEKVTASVNRDRMTEKLTVEDCLQRYLEEKGIKPTIQLREFAFNIIAQAQASSPIGTTSGLFLPVEIEVRNYRSYAEEKLSFEDIFFAMVNGKNGSGKSSLFMDAITDCLYEETREKELTGWIRNGEKSGSISFTFRLGDDTWRVTRTRQRSGKATLALAKEECYGGLGWDDHSRERLVDTQQKIIDLLGMDCDTFQSCVLIMQDRYGKFMEASKEDRMAVLANLLGLGIYDELEKLAKDRLTEANRGIKLLKAEIEKLEGEVWFEQDLLTEVSQIEVLLACAIDDMKVAREELADYQAQLVAIEGYTREISQLEQEVRQKTNAHTEKRNKKSDLQGRVTETESFLKNEQNILDKCAELDSTRLAIASLDGKVQLLNDKKLRCSKINLEISQLKLSRDNITRQLSIISANLKGKDDLEAIVNGSSSIELELQECELMVAEYRKLTALSSMMASENLSYDRETSITLNSKNAKLEGLKKQVEMLDNSNCIDVSRAQCKFLESAKKAAFEAKEMELEIADYTEQRARISERRQKEHVELLDKIEALMYHPQTHEALIKSAKEYREAKDKLAKIAADSATADELFKKYSEQGEKLNELNIEIESVANEISILEAETCNYNQLMFKVRELLQNETLKMEIPKAKQFLVSSAEQIILLDQEIRDLSEEIGKNKNRTDELNKLTADKSTIMVNKIGRENAIKALENQTSELNRQIGTIEAKLEVISSQRISLNLRKEELSTSAKQAAQLQVLVEAFSQDGIPYQIIRDIVPELEAAANEILSQMTGGRMRLEFVTEKVLKSNKAKEIATLEIIIIDVDNGTLPYLSRSGGQKVRCALANSFALAMIKASRVGLQLGMLFIDEPSFLDADGIEGYCTALETIHIRYPDMRILAISHDENMKSRFPQQLYVDVTGNGSKVKRL